MSERKKPYTLRKVEMYVGGDQVQVKEMIALFLSTTPSELSQLSKAVDRRNWEEIYKLAHRIKPSIEVLEVDSVKPLIKEVEISARKQENYDHIASLMKTINTEMDEVFRLLAEEKDK